MPTRRRRQPSIAAADASHPFPPAPHGDSTLLATALHELEHALTVLWDDLAPWQRDNHYIKTGYRPASGSVRRSYASLTYLHNESVNIWSHLGGAVGAALLGLGVLWFVVGGGGRGSYHDDDALRSYETAMAVASPAEILVIGIFFLSAVLCMAMSSTFHTLSNHSPRVATIGNKLDYLGIVLLISGSSVPVLYYGFACHDRIRDLYCATTAILGAICITVAVYDRFRTPEWRSFRAAMFATYGLSAIVPSLHGLWLLGSDEFKARTGLQWILLEAVLYISGACLYAVSWEIIAETPPPRADTISDPLAGTHITREV